MANNYAIWPPDVTAEVAAEVRRRGYVSPGEFASRLACKYRGVPFAHFLADTLAAADGLALLEPDNRIDGKWLAGDPAGWNVTSLDQLAYNCLPAWRRACKRYIAVAQFEALQAAETPAPVELPAAPVFDAPQAALEPWEDDTAPLLDTAGLLDDPGESPAYTGNPSRADYWRRFIERELTRYGFVSVPEDDYTAIGELTRLVESGAAVEPNESYADGLIFSAQVPATDCSEWLNRLDLLNSTPGKICAPDCSPQWRAAVTGVLVTYRTRRDGIDAADTWLKRVQASTGRAGVTRAMKLQRQAIAAQGVTT